MEVRFRFAIKLTDTTMDPEHVTPYGADSPAAPGHGQELLNAVGDHVESDVGLPKSEKMDKRQSVQFAGSWGPDKI